VYGEDTVSERVCQNWFAKFCAGDTTCEDRERSDRPLVVDDDQIKSLIESNPHYTTREIAEIIDVLQKMYYKSCKSFTHTCLRISIRYLGTPQFKQ